MQSDLANFLARCAPVARERQVWGGGTLPLCVTSYLSDELPPLAYVTSVRAVVFRGDRVLAMREGPTWHIVPGGRREGDASLVATLRREVLEESGWTLAAATPLGFMHFHRLAPQLPGHPGPPTDFLQPVYLAEAEPFLADALLPSEYEPDAYTFHPVTEVLTLPVPVVERCFLAAALRWRVFGR